MEDWFWFSLNSSIIVPARIKEIAFFLIIRIDYFH